MCQRLPGDRCSNHLNREVRKRTRQVADIFVASGAISPQELPDKDKKAYDAAARRLRATQEELRHTPTEIKNRQEEAKKARTAGDIAYAEELEASVAESEALRVRRKAGLKKLEAVEKQVERHIETAAYQREEAEQINAEADAKIAKAIEGLSGKEKDNAIEDTASAAKREGWSEIIGIKKALKRLEEGLSGAVDSGNDEAVEQILKKVKKNLLRSAYLSNLSYHYEYIQREKQAIRVAELLLKNGWTRDEVLREPYFANLSDADKARLRAGQSPE